MRRSIDEDGVTIRRLLRDERAADGAACPAAVLDEDRLAEPLRQRLEYDASDDADARARRKRNDGADRPRRPGAVRGGKFAQSRCRKPRNCGLHKAAARRHGCFLSTLLQSLFFGGRSIGEAWRESKRPRRQNESRGSKPFGLQVPRLRWVRPLQRGAVQQTPAITF
jgi:hypothetical protein